MNFDDAAAGSAPPFATTRPPTIGRRPRLLRGALVSAAMLLAGAAQAQTSPLCALLPLLCPPAAVTPAAAPAEAPPTPEGLKGIPVPTPSTLASYVVDKAAAIRLGKALFWDMQVGSDGKTACASCHFHAGADNRSRNQVSPGLNRMASLTTPNPDTTFQIGGPNYQLKLDDYPFHKLSNPADRNSAVLRSVNDVTSSQGVFNEKFLGVTPGAKADSSAPVFDNVFHVGNSNTRRVEPRNTPTVINAVFNFRNFWDGRAQYLFNGVNPFGARDANARVYKNGLGGVSAVQVLIDNASLASQASGPPGSAFEMSADGRSFMDIGKRLLAARPLVQQRVASNDSVLGSLAVPNGAGLTTATYADMVRAAYKQEWWSGTQIVEIATNGTRTIKNAPAGLAPNQYNQMQANFSLMFSLAIQLYESTLVSDDSPFDRHMAGLPGGMTSSQAAGLGLFFGKGKCASCHGGAEFTNASVRKTIKEPLQRMVMGNGGVAVYDEGFYNTAVKQTLEDLHNGGKDPFGRPISNTGLAQQVGSAQFKQIIGITANTTVSPGERIAVNGASKTSTIRNVELTAPYFSNGGAATLRQVVEFYNRGGNFAANNLADLDPDIHPLGLSEDEITQLVDFMTALTDDRVRYQKAPFDHPQLIVPLGQQGDTASVVPDGFGRGVDLLREIPAVGASGYDASRSITPANFLNTALSGSPTFSLVAKHSGKCVDVAGVSTASGAVLHQWDCHGGGNQRFQMVPDEGGSFRLIAAHSQKYLWPSLGLGTDGTQLAQMDKLPGTQQSWHLVDAGGGYYRVYNRSNQKCVDVYGGFTTNAAPVIQWSCHTGANQLFRLQ